MRKTNSERQLPRNAIEKPNITHLAMAYGSYSFITSTPLLQMVFIPSLPSFAKSFFPYSQRESSLHTLVHAFIWWIFIEYLHAVDPRYRNESDAESDALR